MVAVVAVSHRAVVVVAARVAARLCRGDGVGVAVGLARTGEVEALPSSPSSPSCWSVIAGLNPALPAVGLADVGRGRAESAPARPGGVPGGGGALGSGLVSGAPRLLLDVHPGHRQPAGGDDGARPDGGRGEGRGDGVGDDGLALAQAEGGGQVEGRLLSVGGGREPVGAGTGLLTALTVPPPALPQTARRPPVLR